MPPKDSILKLRIPRDLKREAEVLAAERGESLAVLVRESLRGYLDQMRKAEEAARPIPTVIDLEGVDPNEALGKITDHLAKLSSQITKLTGTPRAAAEVLQRTAARSVEKKAAEAFSIQESRALVAEEVEPYVAAPNRERESSEDFSI